MDGNRAMTYELRTLGISLASLAVVVGLSIAWASLSPWLAIAWVVAYVLGFAIGAFLALSFPAGLAALYALPAALEGCPPDANECYAGPIAMAALLLGGSFTLAMLAGILARRHFQAHLQRDGRR
jgi:hypothetical protein